MVVWLVHLACSPDPRDRRPADDPDPAPSSVRPVSAEVVSSTNPAMTLEERFGITLSRPATVDLRCTSADDPLEDHRLSFQGTSGELRLLGVLPGLTYDCSLREPAAGVIWQGSFRSGSLPDGMPELVVSGDPDAAQIDQGYLLFNHWRADEPGHERLIVADGEGRIRWYQDLAEAESSGIAATWLADDGLVLVGGGTTVRPSLRTLSGEIVWEAPPPIDPSPGGYHHEALRTPEGWIVTLQGTPEVDDAVSWEGFRVEARDPATDALIWSFDSRPWTDAGVLARGTDVEHDPHHANAVAWVDDDPLGPSVWVSLRVEMALVRIDRATAEITHVVGPDRGFDLVDPDGDELDAQHWFYGQHDPEFTGGHILLYDNGARPGVPRSRVVQLRMSSAAEVQVEWEWTEPGWFAANFGSVQTLTPGRVLVGTGRSTTPDAAGWIAEIDQASHEVVWRLDFSTPHDSLYRATAIGGCGIFANVRACPELAEEIARP